MFQHNTLLVILSSIYFSVGDEEINLVEVTGIHHQLLSVPSEVKHAEYVAYTTEMINSYKK
jgi:hypothetical protein